jgi:hypothetical protein
LIIDFLLNKRLIAFDPVIDESVRDGNTLCIAQEHIQNASQRSTVMDQITLAIQKSVLTVRHNPRHPRHVLSIGL